MHTGSSGYPKISRVSVRMHTLEHSFSEFRRQTLDPERERLRIPEKSLECVGPVNTETPPLLWNVGRSFGSCFPPSMYSSSGKAGWQKRYRALGGPARIRPDRGWALGIDGWLFLLLLQLRIETKLALELYEPHAKGLLGL